MTFAVVFPGQGSQSVGMLAELAAAEAVVGETFAEAADVLGRDLWALAQAGPAAALADTRTTQPLMFTANHAVWRALDAHGLPTPAAFAGHSLGEFNALVAAGAIGFAEALALVQKRADLMATAVPEGEGGMAAILGLDDDRIVAICESITGERVSEAVNFNSPGQVVISGHVDALEKTIAAATEAGARKGMMLPVSVPNHASLMRPAGEALAVEMQALAWQDAQVPVVQNADARAASSASDLLASLVEHVYNPVRWARTVEVLRDDFGVDTIIESGPGKVLAGLGKRIDRSLTHLPVFSPETLAAALTELTSRSS
ncbi:MAG: [acyl-carrier-protein] S-malonyltransferase [Gammaproteobacteria bacterium]|nr:MAG: [acyl-carrier-protein] S-malonyltransferase [Gammaproteobacteria bacterium]